jgi:hypothetical protein
MKQRLAFALSVLLLAGCGGGGNGGGTTPATPKSQPQSVTGSVVISIPNGTGQTSSSKARYPQFVSPNASSVEMSVNGGADTNFNVAAGSSLCTTVTTGRNCTLTFGAPVGSDTFAFLIFSGPNGTGTQLASATTTQALGAGTAFNFTVAMNAAVGVMVINFTLVHGQGNQTCPDQSNNFNGITEGCAGSAPLQVTVDDPSGATITGSAPYATPISVSGNDPALSASPNQFTAPGQTVTLGYSGVAFTTMTNTAVVTLTAGGQTAQVSIPAEESNLYVANSNAAPGTTPTGGGNVAVYRYGASTPVRTLTGGLTNPETPKLDANGNLYVLDNGPYTTHSAPYINVYAPGASGNATPIYQITNIAAVAPSANDACESMIFDLTGNYLLVVCDDALIHVFHVPTAPTATAASLQTAELGSDSFETPVSIAFDLGGGLYVTDPGNNSGTGALFYFSSAQITLGTTNFTMGPTNSIGLGTGWPENGVAPIGVAVDGTGNVYSTISYFNSTPNPAIDGSNELAVWSATSTPCSNCAPNTTIGGTPFTTHAFGGGAFDPVGDLFLSNPFTNTIVELSRATLAGATGNNIVNPPVARTINTGASPGAPVGMVVGP